jgi:hypothetical protein
MSRASTSAWSRRLRRGGFKDDRQEICSRSRGDRARSRVGCRGTLGGVSISQASNSQGVPVQPGMGPAWSAPRIEPRPFTLGLEWGVGWPGGQGIPGHTMHWSTWSRSKGYGTGEFWAALFPGVEYYYARVTLTNVKVHDGRRYFATMKIAANGRKTIWLKMRGGIWVET